MPSGFRAYALQMIIAADQMINAMLGGWADETLSARAWRLRTKPKWRHVMRAIDRLFFFDRNHCSRAWVNEVHRRHMPPAYRDKNNIDLMARLYILHDSEK